ncbi:DeoR/GlpR transcriptional regulator [Glaciibacter flavus]|uniref:DeoR/GlpR transcriptional regulator n=1 Tax=Orlajensenia flava TaxID=2565934 RepID=A0A4S4G0A1_9MICO|nr:DeoR/GlpR family DNA-binding transcription regulator [Glaciibacter flavus]THG35785.1 DeoR/GlpR transcriptional regulator [Glaciibacter flavus]
MTTDENLPAVVRRERIRVAVAERGFVRVSELAESFGVSGVTARADLDALVDAGHVLRVHGGAVPAAADRAERETSFEESLVASVLPKQRIGEVAASLVRSGQSIILDVGTTTLAVARALCARSDLDDVTVVTNGISIALELEGEIPRFTVVVTGGALRPLQHSLVDPLADVVLERIHADIAFLGCNGVDVAAGVTNVNLPEAAVKTRMLRSAHRAIVVADSSKLGRVHLGRIAGLAEVDTLITDAAATPAALDDLRSAGLDVITTPIDSLER